MNRSRQRGRLIRALTCLVVLAGPVAQAADGALRPRLDSVLGRDVSTAPEGDGGRVIDVLVDGDGQVRAAVVEFGGFLGIGTRKIAVDWSAFRFSGQAILVDISRDQLRAAPEYKPNEAGRLVKPNADR